MAREVMLLPFVEMVEDKPNGNQYLGIYYYEANLIRSIEPSKEGHTAVHHLDGSVATFSIKPIEFFKLIVKLEQSINLNCIEECKKVDAKAVQILTEGFTFKTI